MPLTPWRKLNLEWQRSRNKLVVIRVQIDIYFLSCIINRILESVRPKDPCYIAPLCTLSKLDPSTDTAASAVSVVIAVFKVLSSSIV
jgi:hypothetical protein